MLKEKLNSESCIHGGCLYIPKVTEMRVDGDRANHDNLASSSTKGISLLKNSKNYKETIMNSTDVFKRSLLSVAIVTALSTSISNAVAAECDATPNTNGDVVVNAGVSCEKLDIEENLSGNIQNNGDITFLGSSIYIDGAIALNGTAEKGLINRGNITATGDSESGVTAGIFVDNYQYEPALLVQGLIENANGAVINAENGQKGVGILYQSEGNIQAKGIINSGTINSSEDGIRVNIDNGSVIGNVINEGIIKSKNGIYFDSYLGTAEDVTNTGSISSEIYGIDIEANDGSVFGNIKNEGSINILSDESNAAGIYVNAIYDGSVGNIINTGTINSTDIGIEIYADSESKVGDIINKGTISGGNSGIDVYSDLGNIINTGTIIGDIYFSPNYDYDVLDTESSTPTQARRRVEMAGGRINGHIHDVNQIEVTGTAAFTGDIYTDEELTTLDITDTGRLQILAGSENVDYQANLNQTGILDIHLNSSNNLLAETTEARITLDVPRDYNGEEGLRNGSANLAKGSSILVTPDYRGDFKYGDTEQYRVLTTEGGITGTANVASQTILFNVADTDYSATDLNVTIKTTDLAAAVLADTGDVNASRVADALQTYLSGLNQGEAANFIDKLLTVSDVDGLVSVLDKEAPNLNSESLSAALLAPGQIQSEVFSNILIHLASLSNGGRSGVASGDLIERNGVWFKAITSEAEQNKQRNNGVTFNGYDSRLRGFTFGGDVDVSDQLTVGSSFSYATADINVKKSSAKSDIESYQLSLYSKWQQGDWFVDGVANLGINDTSSKSYNGAVKITSDYDSKQYGLHVAGGKKFWFNDKDTLIEPQVSLEYSLLDTDSYKQKFSDGRTTANVKTDDFKVLELGAGVRMSHLVELDRGILLPEASLMVFHDFKADGVDSEVTADVFNQSLSFKTKGVDPEKTSYLAGLGVSYWMDNNVNLSLNYEHKWASGFKSNNVQTKVRYNF